MSAWSTNCPHAAYIYGIRSFKKGNTDLRFLYYQLGNLALFRKVQSLTCPRPTKLGRVTEFMLMLIPELLTVA